MPDTVAGWGVDVVTNAVVIDVVGRASAALAFARAAGAPGDAIRIEHVAERPRLYSNLIGGQEIFNASGRCSLGFSARLGGTRYVLTAGHCTALDGTTWRQGSTTFGSTATSSFPGDDYGTIRVTNAAALSTPLVDRYSAGDDVSVAGSTAVAVGGAVCRSGATTEWHCGAVTAKNQSVAYPEGVVSGLTRTTACSERGDSGGSFVSSPGAEATVQAQGMTSGGSGNCTTGGTTFFQPVAEPLTKLNLTLVTTGSTTAANDDAYSTPQDTALHVEAPGVLANDVDPEDDPLTATVVTQPAHGSLVLDTSGSFDYTPVSGFSGPDTFIYQASDGTHTSNAVVKITVVAPTEPPTADDDSYSTTEDTDLSEPAPGVLGNDSGADGTTLTAELVSGPDKGGSVELAANGSFTYTPNTDFNGTETFAYKASDGNLDSAVATVSITVTPAPDPPFAGDDFYSTDEDAPLTVPAPGVLVNDGDVDGDPVTAVPVAGPANGQLTLNADGSFTYTPNADFNGTDSFTYQARAAATSRTSPRCPSPSTRSTIAPGRARRRSQHR